MLLSKTKVTKLLKPVFTSKLISTEQTLIKYSKKIYIVNLMVKDNFITKPEYNNDGLIMRPKKPSLLLLEDYINSRWNIDYVYYMLNNLYDTNKDGFREILKL